MVRELLPEPAHGQSQVRERSLAHLWQVIPKPVLYYQTAIFPKALRAETSSAIQRKLSGFCFEGSGEAQGGR